MTNRRNAFAPRWRAVFAALAATAVLGGCDLLTVTNPGAITEEDLEDPERIPLMVHGAMGEFQRAYGWYALYSGTYSGELTDTHVFAENRDVQFREVSPFTGLLATAYTRLQRARAAGDDVAERIRGMLGPEAESHLGVARALIHSGYALTLLAESYCEAPIDVSAAHSPETLFGMAIDRFEDAMGVASRGQGANPTAPIDSLVNVARVGAARAALNRGDLGQAATFAGAVPADFEFWIAFSDNSSAEYNQFWNATRITASNAHLQPGPGFLESNDPRIPRTELQPLQTPAGFGSLEGYVPLPPLNYEGFGDTELIQQGTDVRLATGLEARYIVAEAEGPTAGTLSFVNERRAVGGQDPVSLDGGALMAELREQRSRDLYLTGHRLGDLRRYIATGAGNFFPTGDWVFGGSRQFGTGTCWPIPNSELTSNPNL